MKIVPYDLKKIDKADGYKKSNNQKIIEEFLESDLDCAKIENWTQKSAMSCAGSLNRSIVKYKMTGARAISRNGEVFLIRVSAIE